MDRLSFFTQKLLTWLRIRPTVGGLDISDQVLRLVYFDGTEWQLHSEKLEPEVLKEGKIKDRQKFLAALTLLKGNSKIGGGGGSAKKVSVVVTFGSVNVYSQVLNLPPLTGDELAKAVELNLQMASPEETSKMYSGWQAVGKNEVSGNLEVLSSFIEKEAVDEMVQALFEAGFLTMAVEPRSVALTRILREKGSGVDPKKAYLLVGVDNVGVNFLVIRNGQPYFEYGNRWTEIAEENGEVTIPKFTEELTGSLRKVLNFYSQHWGDPIAAVIISAVALHEEIEKTIAATVSSVPTVRLTLEMGQQISSEWLVALGSDLRGLREKIGESEINLIGEEWRFKFEEEQMSRFLSFWQVLIPVSLGILVLVFIIADSFLGNVQASLKTTAILKLGTSQTANVGSLEASSTAFNAEVAMIQTLEEPSGFSAPILNDIASMANADGITINHLTFAAGASNPIVLDGTAPSEDRILAFKNALSADSHISAINLPVTDIQSNNGSYSFSVTFTYSP